MDCVTEWLGERLTELLCVKGFVVDWLKVSDCEWVLEGVADSVSDVDSEKDCECE